MKRIYVDYAALTPVDKRVIREMKRYGSAEYGNPSSLYKEGVAAKAAIILMRKKIADFFHAHADEILFTGSGTEANNIALQGVVADLITRQGKTYKDIHMLISAIEHPSIIECVIALQKLGVQVEKIAVNERGIVDVKDLKEKIRPNTAIVSVMMVNNEIGTIQPIYEIAKLIRHARKVNGGSSYPYFHTDASQAVQYIPMDVRNLGVDMITVDAHKMYGPRGIGALWLRRDTAISPIIFGGKQERGLRSGTENLPGIAGFAKAFELIQGKYQKEVDRIRNIRENFLTQMLKEFPQAVLNGDREERIENNASIYFPGIDGEFLVLQLDAFGISCSTKSSCLRDEDESYVIRAIGGDHARASSSIRFSFGRESRMSDISRIIRALKKAISVQETAKK